MKKQEQEQQWLIHFTYHGKDMYDVECLFCNGLNRYKNYKPPHD